MTDKLDIEALEAKARAYVPFGYSTWLQCAEVNRQYFDAFRPEVTLTLIAAYREREALTAKLAEAERERDEARALAYHQDGDLYCDLWKLSRENVGRVAKRANELRAAGEDVAQMLVQRDKEAERESSSLRSRVEALEEALRPFAKEAKRYASDAWEDDDSLTDHDGLTVGDFRRARAALEPTL